MPTSPTLSISEPRDVFERLAACRGFLTARDVAKMLAISEKTVYSYVSRNMIPHYKIEANVRFRPLELAEWLRNHAGLTIQPALSSGRPAVQ
jgi:excisionase family DNA binding protein